MSKQDLVHRHSQPSSAVIGHPAVGDASPKKLRKRRSEIIRELCDLSRDGWSRPKYDDYAPLEAELRTLDALR